MFPSLRQVSMETVYNSKAGGSGELRSLVRVGLGREKRWSQKLLYKNHFCSFPP